MQVDRNTYSGLFGLRLSHSLHFGHLVGNVRPAMNDQNVRTIVVVLADLFTYTSDRKQDITVNNALSMTAEAMALGLSSPNVKFVTQSQVFNNLLPLFTVLSCLLKFEKLKTTKPISKMLEKNLDLKFGELTFPIIQCAEMVSTNSEILYSNIDNLGIVSLTEDLYHKLGSYANTDLPKPRISHGEFKNIRGTDGNKMSQGRNNAIFIDDDEATIKKKVTSIHTHSTEKEIDLQIVYDYFKVVGYSSKDLENLENEFNKGKTTPLKIKNLLSSEIVKYFTPIKNKKEEIMQDKKILIERINSDTETVKFAVKENVNNIFENFYSKEFFQTFKY